MLRWFFKQSLHMRIAIIFAPFMLIGGYGLMDLWVTKDQPKQDKPVAMQPLQLQGECLLATNQCKLQHATMQVSMVRLESGKPGIVRLEITPNVSVRGIQMSLVQADTEHQLVIEPMRGAEVWYAEFPEKLLTPSPSVLRIALAQFGRVSYAEIPPHF
ncbi:hypothetical protein J9253_00580 [Thiothrix litoralis]|uniref:Uncharacterized protein n=1 Tax=Thiothrix litoralis TaxID=2891210 RepID=A0ABX7WRH5_9GAMM|nr:hypothetical protein [Thiothrix litoralis]QTR46494.1 hypothetical protein J9253_00580 [Thiothrix litoralis]